MTDDVDVYQSAVQIRSGENLNYKIRIVFYENFRQRKYCTVLHYAQLKQQFLFSDDYWKRGFILTYLTNNLLTNLRHFLI